MAKAGYEYLLAWKITVPIYDYTVLFCKQYRNLLSSTRTFDQMVQSARSGTTNIAEGYQQSSLMGYAKLTGVNRGSLEELLKDFLSFSRQNKIEVWPKEKVEREVGELREVWTVLNATPTLPDNPNFPDLPNDLTKTVNLMITLLNQATYLQRKLEESLEKKFIQQGGFRENLFRKRVEYRSQKR